MHVPKWDPIMHAVLEATMVSLVGPSLVEHKFLGCVQQHQGVASMFK